MIQVGLVEDQKETREGLVRLIDQSEGFRVAGAYESMEEALRNIPRNPPKILVVDIGLPGMSGIEGIQILKERYPDISFVVLTIHEDDERIFNALCAGATGYLLKNVRSERLIESLREAAEGGAPMSASVARRVIRLFERYRPSRKSDHNLTPHESRLLKMLVEGHNYTTASKELGVSINTVAFHMRHIYEKLQVHSKSEAVSRALRDHII